MKKSGRIHPTRPSAVPAIPEEVAGLTTVLSQEERDVLYYLLSVSAEDCSVSEQSTEHAPQLGCSCFDCYKVCWEKWDSSPNQDIIHEIIEKVEEENSCNLGKKRRRSRKTRRRKANQQQGMEFGYSRVSESTTVIGRIMRFVGGKFGGIWK